MKLHHIGIIVSNISREKELYQALGYEAEGMDCLDAIQHNKILFMTNPFSKERIELIEPLDESSTVAKLPKGLAHLCYQVEDLEEFLASFQEKRLGIVFAGPLEAPAMEGRRIAFAYLKNKTIIEIVESMAIEITTREKDA